MTIGNNGCLKKETGGGGNELFSRQALSYESLTNWCGKNEGRLFIVYIYLPIR
jgi:hypothetical protein